MTEKIKVKTTKAEVNVPLLGGGFITWGVEVEVADCHFYRRAILDGDLALVGMDTVVDVAVKTKGEKS